MVHTLLIQKKINVTDNIAMINLYDILQEILTETVTPQDVNDAINNKIQVIINYSDEKNRAPNRCSYFFVISITHRAHRSALPS